jgi:hypothetical protein
LEKKAGCSVTSEYADLDEFVTASSHCLSVLLGREETHNLLVGMHAQLIAVPRRAL